MSDSDQNPFELQRLRQVPIGNWGEFAKLMSVIVIELQDSREFWTTDGRLLGVCRRKDAVEGYSTEERK